MKYLHRTAVGGLLWLAFCAVASATTIDLTYNFNAGGDGGGFSAYLNGNSADTFEVFCVDYANQADWGNPYLVNVDTVGDTVADTRYGTTTTFTDDAPIIGSFSQAQMQYILAGWLTTQYDLGNSLTNAQIAQNNDIQYAIWDLLTVTSPLPYPAGSTEITAAINWADSLSVAQLQAFADTVNVYTSVVTSEASIPGRYSTGAQEMISVTPTPEPAAMALVGASLIALGLFRRRKSSKV